MDINTRRETALELIKKHLSWSGSWGDGAIFGGCIIFYNNIESDNEKACIL